MLSEKYIIALVAPLVAAVLGRFADAVSDWSDALFGSNFSSPSLQKLAALLCCTDYDDDVEARLRLLVDQEETETKGKSKFTIDYKLWAGEYGWEEIGKEYGWTFEKTLAVSVLRLVFWHLLQPAFFFVSFYFYHDDLTHVQAILATMVIANEAVYCLATFACLLVNPAFLVANVKDSKFLFQLMYVCTPNNYVWFCFSFKISTVLSNNHKRDGGNCWALLFLAFGFVAVVVPIMMAAADISAIAALIIDAQFHNLPLPLGIGCMCAAEQ